MFIVRYSMYNVRYRQKTYDILPFLQVLAIFTYDIVYEIVLFFNDVAYDV
jgi:hypothetical protein